MRRTRAWLPLGTVTLADAPPLLEAPGDEFTRERLLEVAVFDHQPVQLRSERLVMGRASGGVGCAFVVPDRDTSDPSTVIAGLDPEGRPVSALSRVELREVVEQLLRLLACLWLRDEDREAT